jgi:hypothetical protein
MVTNIQYENFLDFYFVQFYKKIFLQKFALKMNKKNCFSYMGFFPDSPLKLNSLQTHIKKIKN